MRGRHAATDDYFRGDQTEERYGTRSTNTPGTDKDNVDAMVSSVDVATPWPSM